MALTGELSDLSLAELIEFFCNQRKTGRLKVVYPIGPGYFYLQTGSVVHARIGVLLGIEAVFCALTLPNASFTFSAAFEAPEQTINQPWTSVVLEGLRRMDEGIAPPNPFPDQDVSSVEEVKTAEPVVTVTGREEIVFDDSHETKKAPIDYPVSAPEEMPGFLGQAGNESSWRRRPWTFGAVLVAVALLLAVIGVPWGMYARSKAAKLAEETRTTQAANTESATPSVPASTDSPAPVATETTVPAAGSSDDADLQAKRQHEARARERAKAQEGATAIAGSTLPEAKETPNTSNLNSAKPQPSTSAARKVTVQVTYDENGRVTQASGGDANALRIARQKRFPAGKAGSATVTIPIN
jgi:hypothetical protein